MALVSHIEAIIRERYLKGGKLQENFFKDVPILNALNKKTNISGGESIQQRIRHKGMVAGTVIAYDGLDPFPTEKGDFATKAKWGWTNIVASIVMAGEDMRKAETKEDMINFVDEHVNHALLGAKDELRKFLILSDSVNPGPYAKAPNGFALVYGDGVLPYGNITAAEIPDWLAQRNVAAIDLTAPTAATITAFKKALIDNVTDNASAGMRPTMIAVGRDIYNRLYQYAVEKSFIVTTVPKTAKGKRMAEMGFETLEVDGVPLMVDTLIPAGHAYSWSDESLWLQVHPKANFNTLPDGNGKQMMLEKINRKDAYAFDLVIMCQLISPERRALAVCTNILA